MQRRRDLGGLIFVNLRDRSGIIQVVFDRDINEEAFNLAHEIRNEFVLTIRGVVTHREKGQCNDSIPTGHIEIKAEHLEILNTAKTPPIYIDDDDVLDESIRLKYRYLDLRKPKMQNILMTVSYTHLDVYKRQNIC